MLITAFAILGGVALLFAGYLAGLARGSSAGRDTQLLDFLEAGGYSLQCLRGTNGDDDAWAVTDGANGVIGLPGYDLREAVEAATGNEPETTHG